MFKLKNIQKILLATAFFLAVGCSGSNTIIEPPVEPGPDPDGRIVDKFQQKSLDTENHVQDGSGNADIIFVIDNSVSMQQEQYNIGLAAPSVLNAVQGALSGVNLQFSVITTNTFGTASTDPFYQGTFMHNPNATYNEINSRESVMCFDPTDPRYNASLCGFNWWVNGTLGFPAFTKPISFPDPSTGGGVNVLTGKEVDFNTKIADLLARGLAGHWLESPAMATGMFIQNVKDGLIPAYDNNHYTRFIVVTDVNDASNAHNNDGNSAMAPLDDSRDPNCDSNDPRCHKFYDDLVGGGFFNHFTGFKGSAQKVGMDLFAGIQGISDYCLPPAGTLESMDTRLTPFVGALDAANPNHHAILSDVCALNSFSTALSAIGNNIVDQLNRQFDLNYNGAEPIDESSLVVFVNGTPTTAFVYDAVAKLITMDVAPTINSTVEIMFFAPKMIWKCSKTPDPSTIKVHKINSDGSLTQLSGNWTYDGNTNAISWTPEAGTKFQVSYLPVVGEF